MSVNRKHIRNSKHPKIDAGWYYGMIEDVRKGTGLSRPTIILALRNGDTSTGQRFEAVKKALELIEERENAVA